MCRRIGEYISLQLSLLCVCVGGGGGGGGGAGGRGGKTRRTTDSNIQPLKHEFNVSTMHIVGHAAPPPPPPRTRINVRYLPFVKSLTVVLQMIP